MSLLLLIVILLIIFGGWPGVCFDHSYGYYPPGLGGVLLIILVILLITGRI